MSIKYEIVWSYLILNVALLLIFGAVTIAAITDIYNGFDIKGRIIFVVILLGFDVFLIRNILWHLNGTYQIEKLNNNLVIIYNGSFLMRNVTIRLDDIVAIEAIKNGFSIKERDGIVEYIYCKHPMETSDKLKQFIGRN